ncbi:MAG: M60 family metallopeptidase [Bacteroidaceae bacterium]|nr:M60 family metallopeptidase [Bacteroidaceae bacterium]
MNTLFKYMAGAAMMLALAAQPAKAQVESTEATPVLITPHAQTIGALERTLCYTIQANTAFSVESDATDWLTVYRVSGDKVYLHAASNFTEGERTGNITFTAAEGEYTNKQTLTITQLFDNFADEVPEDIEIKPRSSSASASQSGEGIERTYDGSLSTLWHSPYNTKINATNTVTLTYNFSGVERIDYFNYVPRQDGTANGYFGLVDVYVTANGESEKLYGSYDFGQSSAASSVVFSGGLINPTRIRIVVKSGSNGFASCAEMQFRETDPAIQSQLNVFADDIYSELRPDVTADEIEALTNPFIKSVAYKLFNNTYSREYRIGTYGCYSSPEYISDMLNAPGKYYDHCEGVTGIQLSKGKHVIAVSGIPEGMGSVGLRVVAWYSKELNDKGEGAGPAVYTFSLRNGMNTIEYTNDFPGLAYINYYVYGEPDEATHPDIKVHFINGEVNGYLSKDKTNDEMHNILAKAVNRCIDVVGQRVHSVWEVGYNTNYGLYKHCKTRTGALKGYHQFMNCLDSLIVWEHRLLGLEKYNHIPKNHTMAYVNYTYYMFQGYYGVSFMYNQQSRVLSCQQIMTKDDDAIWGLSHEWGHQHQMLPYYCWGGLAEVSNNIFSYYNIMAMGYHTSDKINNYWPNGRNMALNDQPYKNGTTYNSSRHLAYQDRNSAASITFNSDFTKLATYMADSLVHPATDDVVATWQFAGGDYEITSRMLGIDHIELGAPGLTPFVMLNLYATRNWNATFPQDLFESLRMTDDENGSVLPLVEKNKNGVDKYELIASAQNGNKNGKYAVLRSMYPNSCWVKRGYLTKSGISKNDNTVPFIFNFIRKASRATGYNLVPYFERWGFLRTIAQKIGDYGNFYHLMTPEMLEEFKADMDALVADGTLQTIDESIVNAISNSKDMFQVEFGTTPNIPNE